MPAEGGGAESGAEGGAESGAEGDGGGEAQTRRRRVDRTAGGADEGGHRRRHRSPAAGGASEAPEGGGAGAAGVEAQELPEVVHSPRVLSADLLASPRAGDDSPRGGPPAPPASAFDMGAALALVQAAKKGELAKTATPSPREEQGPGDILALAAARARQKRKEAKKDPERAAAEEAEREKREQDAADAASSLNYELDAAGAFRVVAPGAADVAGGGLRGWDRLRAQSMPNVQELEKQAVNDKPPVPGNPLRRACFHVEQSRYFKGTIILTILFNAVILALEPTLRLEGQQVLLDTSETVCNVIFTVEMVFKLMALGFCKGKHAYCASGWNLIDALIVLSGWTTFVFDRAATDDDNGTNISSLLRLFRVLRPLRSMTVIPMLRDIINAMIAAVKDLGNNMLIILFFLFMFGIFCVSLFSGMLRNRCYDAVEDSFFEPKGIVCGTASFARQCDFETTGRHNATCEDSGDMSRFKHHLEEQRPYFVKLENGTAYANYANPDFGVMTFDDTLHAFLAIFQVWAGVGWTYLAYKVIDAHSKTWLYFFSFIFLLGAWFLINLVIAVLGTSYRRQQDLQQQEKKERKRLANQLKERQQRGEKRKLAALVAATAVSRLRAAVDSYKENMNSGDVAQFADADAERASKRARLAGEYAQPRSLRDRARALCSNFFFRSFIVCMILGNTAMTAVDNPYLSDRRRELMELLGQFFGWIFFLEAALKLFALGWREYCRSPLNIFDGFMVFMFLVEFSLNFAGINATALFAAMRTFRVLRVFKLARSVRRFRVLLTKMARAVATVTPMIIVLHVFLFIFAVLSMQVLTGMYDDIYGGVCDDAKPWKHDPKDTSWHEGAAYDAWWEAFNVRCARKPRWHFDEFQYAFLTVFQVIRPPLHRHTYAATHIIPTAEVARCTRTPIVFLTPPKRPSRPSTPRRS